MKNRHFVKSIFVLCSLLLVSFKINAQSNSNRIMFGVGALYERGLDATISVEHETKHHNAWEYFANGYIKYAKDPRVGHITKDSFWKHYRTWSVGAAYKPCVFRGKNNYGNLRFGGSIGSDTHEFLGLVHAGYEHNYALRKGWQIYWQVKTDFCINGKDLFRTGVVLGFKIPTSN